MKHILLSIFFPFLLCIVNNGEVSAASPPGIEIEKFSPTDPRLEPPKYCDAGTKCTPTIRTATPFNVGQDMHTLYHATVDEGTKEKIIISTVTRLSSLQRLQLCKSYRTKGRSLVNGVLKRELSGAFEIAIVAVMMPLPILYAEELQKTVTTPKADERTLVEILCTVNNFGIKSIVEIYKEVYGHPLQDDVVKSTTGSFQKVIVSLIQGKRGEGKVDNDKATADAKALHEATAKPWKDKPTFSEILGTRSYAQLVQVFAEYKKVSGREIEDDIKKEFPSGDWAGLLDMVKCIRSKTKFFAEKLNEVIGKKGAEMDIPLIRILVSRSEIDLQDIKVEYESLYKKPLEKVVADKIGSNYRRTLTDMIRGNAGKAP